MAAYANNPFTLVYDKMWELALASQPLRSRVSLKNRINFNEGVDDPLKRNVISADMPELMLTVEGLAGFNGHNTSCSSMCAKRYGWIISTGSYRLEILQDVEFFLMCAMLGWKSSITALQWEGKSFVKRCNFTDAASGDSVKERNRGIIGWTALWHFDVEMHFTTNDLIAINSGTGE